MSHNKKIPPEIEKMLEKDGLYLLIDPRDPNKSCPIWVQHGMAYSMQLDSQLCPHGFFENLIVQGPLTNDHALASPPSDPSVN